MRRSRRLDLGGLTMTTSRLINPWSGPGPVPQSAFKAGGGASYALGRFDSFAAPSGTVERE